LLRSPEAEVHQLVRIGNDDPAFAGALLRLANSAESSPLMRVRTIRDAVVRLGVPQARRTIIGVTLTKAFRGAGGSNIDEHELWRHLVAVGMLADELAWGRVAYSDAFTAGLLHDIGRLAMATEDPKRYAQVVLAARASGQTSALEHHLFGRTHTEWGAAIGSRWGIPDDIVEAIADHHGGEVSGLSWVLKEARERAFAMGIGDGVLPGVAEPMNAAAGTDRPILQRIDKFVKTVRHAA
jgi:putative nucleotidyltransferase with HDIG domain